MLKKPLRHIQQLPNNDGLIAVVEVKYERLPNFYYFCGLLVHIERDYQLATEEGKEDEKQWGSWLRASL